MKKIILMLLTLLIACGKQVDADVAKVKSSQNFICNGFWYEEESENRGVKEKESRRVEYKMNLKKWDKEFKSYIGTTLGNIDLEGYESLPICYESEFKYTFFPSCNVSSYKEKLPNSRHYGSLDKVDGKITYEIRYDEGNVTYSKTLLLNCSPIKENLVK